MGHNRAGEARKRRLKARKKEQQRLWCGAKPDPNPVAPLNSRGVGATFFLYIHKIRLDARSQAKLFVNPHKGATSPMRKILRREIRKGGVSPITVVKEGDGYRLVAGERRFMACRQLGYKRIPCRIIEPIEKLDPDDTADRAALAAAFGDNFYSRRFEKLE